MMFTGPEPFSVEDWELVRRYWQAFNDHLWAGTVATDDNPSYECFIISYGPLT